MPDYSKYEFIKVEKTDKLATVTLNRPDALNAVNSQLHHELEHIWIDLGEDSEINAILLTGAGRAFSAGGDVKNMANRWGTDEGKKWALTIGAGRAPADPEHARSRTADHRRDQRRRDGPGRQPRAAL